MKLTPHAVCRRRGVSRERHTRNVAIGRMGVIIMWGVTAGKGSHNTSNARAVTADKTGRNSCMSKVPFWSMRPLMCSFLILHFLVATIENLGFLIFATSSCLSCLFVITAVLSPVYTSLSASQPSLISYPCSPVAQYSRNFSSPTHFPPFQVSGFDNSGKWRLRQCDKEQLNSFPLTL